MGRAAASSVRSVVRRGPVSAVSASPAAQGSGRVSRPGPPAPGLPRSTPGSPPGQPWPEPGLNAVGCLVSYGGSKNRVTRRSSQQVLQVTVMCPRPRPRSFASRAGPQPQGVQLTLACPGPTSWPNGQRRGRWSNICTGTRWSCPRRPRRNPPACPVLRSSRTPRSWRQTGYRPSRGVRTMAVLPRPVRPMLGNTASQPAR